MAKELKARYSSPRELYNSSIHELMLIKGIGHKKAIQLKAAIELSLKINEFSEHRSRITMPADVSSLLMSELRYLNKEPLQSNNNSKDIYILKIIQRQINLYSLNDTREFGCKLL